MSNARPAGRARILFENACVITMDGDRTVYDGGGVLVEGDRIGAVGRIDPASIGDDVERVDASGRLILPGLINTHVHTSQQLGRGLADDVDLLTWLRDRMWPFESSLDDDEQYVSTLACCAELIRSGVTTFAEAGGQQLDGMARGVIESGMRAVLCHSIMDTGEGLPRKWVQPAEACIERQLESIERWHGAADDRIRIWFGLRTLFNCSDDLVRRTRDLAAEHGVGVNMHLAEIIDEVRYVEATRGTTPVAHMADLGALGPNLLAVHAVWLTPREIDLFLQYDVKVSHNPAAAMKMLGFASIPEMLDRGICVTLGTDGAPSNNRMDLLDEMYLASLIHKGRRLDPTVVPAQAVLEMATVNGARALLRDDEIGALRPGARADLVVLDPRAPGSYPLHDPVSAVVYNMHASNVEHSLCDGRWLMRDRRLTWIDEAALMEEVQQRAMAIRARCGIDLPDRFPVVRVRG